MLVQSRMHREFSFLRCASVDAEQTLEPPPCRMPASRYWKKPLFRYRVTVHGREYPCIGREILDRCQTVDFSQWLRRFLAVASWQNTDIALLLFAFRPPPRKQESACFLKANSNSATETPESEETARGLAMGSILSPVQKRATNSPRIRLSSLPQTPNR